MTDKDDTNNHNQEVKLFRELMGDVRSIKRDVRAPNYKKKPEARARFRREEEKTVLKESLETDIDETEASSGGAMQFQRATIGTRTMRKLKRGAFTMQGEIDLHGMTVPEAKANLRVFISDSLEKGYTCVRIIHGKGLGSGNRGPILKTKVNVWLRRWDQVLAFVSAKQIDGGTGALYVLLKKL